MAHSTQTPDTDKPVLSPLSNIGARLFEYGHNASNNIQNSFANMTLQSWVRLIAIVGGYMLLRPYIMRWAGKSTVARMEQDDVNSRSKDEAISAATTPNEFRGIKEKLYEADDDEGDGTGADWGQRARLRQREMLKTLLEEEERRREAEAEDADIQEFLVD